MNYFQLYGYSIKFGLDLKEIKQKYYELSKKYHPDFYINEGLEKQEEILQLSTLNNKAYQTFTNPQKLIAYILDQYNLLEEGEKYQLPQDFLLDMMEINEVLMDFQLDNNSEDIAAIQNQVDKKKKDLNLELTAAQLKFDNEPDSGRPATLLTIKDIWYRQKYLLRIQDTLNTFASR